MSATLPPKTNVILWKVDGNWSFNIVYPPGVAAPADAKPFNIRNENTLAEVHSELIKHFDDERLTGGHPPGAADDEDPDFLENGTLIVIERDNASWKCTAFDRNGGLSARHAHYSSVSDVFEGLRQLYGEK